VKLTGGGGAGAEAVAEINLIQYKYDGLDVTCLYHVRVKSHGTGYTSAPKVEVESPAEVVARLQAEAQAEEAQARATKEREAEHKAEQRALDAQAHPSHDLTSHDLIFTGDTSG